MRDLPIVTEKLEGHYSVFTIKKIIEGRFFKTGSIPNNLQFIAVACIVAQQLTYGLCQWQKPCYFLNYIDL